MTRYFVGPGGNNSNNGTTYALRRLTLTSIETLVAAGDEVQAAPGVYRETLTCTTPGGSNYTTGTVSVTNGSAVITGSGTSWLANAFANGQFRTTSLASAADGVANGTTTFTSAGGNFQAGHVGLVIQIAGKGAYTITARASATSITLDGSPTAGSSLSYSIMTPGPIEILSVDSDTQITLKQNWAYPSFTGLAYITYKDIKYIADVTGVNTDGVGGIVRITGSDNDQTNTRAGSIDVNSRSYRTFRQFDVDMNSSVCIAGLSATDFIIEDFVIHDSALNAISAGNNASQLRWTIRRIETYNLGGVTLNFTSSTTVSDSNHLIENCILHSRSANFNTTRVGGISIRNVTLIGGGGISVVTALAVGQAIHLTNSILAGLTSGLIGTVTGEIVEDYNSISNSGTARTNTATGAHSNTFPALHQPPILVPGSIFTNIRGMLSAASQLGSIAGLNPPIEDLYGIVRAATSSWGAVQYSATQRPSDAGEPRGRRGNYQ